MAYREIGDGRGLPLDIQALEDNLTELFNAAATSRVLTGTGSPEGAVASAVGTLYLRQDGGTSTTLYVREAAGAAVAAEGTLTGTTIAAGNTVTIAEQNLGAGVVYTYVTNLTNPAVPYEVKVGVSDSVSLDNLIAAINGDSGAGTIYGTGTVALTEVLAAAGAGDTMTLTAVTAGSLGNLIRTSATLTAGGWGAATLTGGLDDDGTGWVPK